MVSPPQCRICGASHWTTKPHIWPKAPSLQADTESFAKPAVPGDPKPKREKPQTPSPSTPDARDALIAELRAQVAKLTSELAALRLIVKPMTTDERIARRREKQRELMRRRRAAARNLKGAR